MNAARKTRSGGCPRIPMRYAALPAAFARMSASSSPRGLPAGTSSRLTSSLPTFENERMSGAASERLGATRSSGNGY